MRLLRDRHGLRIDMAHLVDGGARGRRRFRHLRGVRLARQSRGPHPGARSHAHRSGQSRLSPRGARFLAGDDAMSTIAVLPAGAVAFRPDDGPDGLVGYRSDAGPTSKRILAGYGFWLFLLSDIVMFAAFFAAYAVLAHETAGGPSGVQLFDLKNVAIGT